MYIRPFLVVVVLTLAAPVMAQTFTGTVTQTTGGMITWSSSGPYSPGQVILVRAWSNVGYVFDGWGVTGMNALDNWAATTTSLTVNDNFRLTAAFSTTNSQSGVLPNVMPWPADWLGIYGLDHGGPRSTAAGQAWLATLRATGANYDWVERHDPVKPDAVTWIASMIRCVGLKVGAENSTGDGPLADLHHVTYFTNCLRPDAVYFDSECTYCSHSPSDQLMALANSMTTACQWNPGVTTPTYFYNTGIYFPQAAGSGACPADYNLYRGGPNNGPCDLGDDEAYAAFTASPGGLYANELAGIGYDAITSTTTRGYFWFNLYQDSNNYGGSYLTPYLLGKICTFLKAEDWQGVAFFPGPAGYSPVFSASTTAYGDAKALSLMKVAISAFNGTQCTVALTVTGSGRSEATGPFAWAGAEPDSSRPAVSHPYFVNQHGYYLRHFSAAGSGWAITGNGPGRPYNYGAVSCWTLSSSGDDLTGMVGDYQNVAATLHVTADGVPTYSLTAGVSLPGAGTVTVSPTQASYFGNTPVRIVATPAYGYVFRGWKATHGILRDAAAPTTTFTVMGNSVVTATFRTAQ